MSDDIATRILSELQALREEVAELRNRETYDTAEAASYLKCAESTIRAMVRDGMLIPIRAGSDFRFLKCDLDSNRVQSRAVRAAAILRERDRKRKARETAT